MSKDLSRRTFVAGAAAAIGLPAPAKEHAALATVGPEHPDGATATAVLSAASRDAFVAAVNAGLDAPRGRLVRVGDLTFMAEPGAQAIADLPGWSPLAPVFLEHFATNAAPGVTNLADALSRALAFCGARLRDLHIGPGPHLFERETGHDTVAGMRIVGTRGSSLIFRTRHGRFHNFLRLADRSGLSNLDIRCEGPGDSNIHFLLAVGDHIRLDGIRFDGTMTGNNGERSFLLCSQTVSASDVIVRDCRIRRYKWLCLKANAATSTHDDWTWRDCRFERMYAPSNMNTPNGTARDWLWQNCRFSDNLAGNGFEHLSGTAGGEGHKWVNCWFEGKTDFALHFEESTRCAVVNCGGALAGGGFVEILENTVGAIRPRPNDGLVITGNSVRSDGTPGAHGILVVNDGDGPGARRLVVSGNVMEGFDRGYSLGTVDASGVGNVVRDNVAHACTTGFMLFDATRAITDNTVVACDLGLQVQNAGGALGGIRFVDMAPRDFLSVRRGRLVIDEIVAEHNRLPLAAGPGTYPLLPLPAGFDADLGVHVSGTWSHLVAHFKASWDGAEESGFDTPRINDAGGGLSAPRLVRNDTELALVLTRVAETPEPAGRLHLVMRGTVVF